MPLNITANSVRSNLFVRIEVSPSNVLRFSDMKEQYAINGEVYQGLGQLMDVTTNSSELRVTGDEISITVTGIPNTSITDILNTKIKGAKVSIYRAFFAPNTASLILVEGNPVGKFFGFVNNYQLAEEYDIQAREASNTIIMTCSSVVDVLNNKVGGRKTNPSSHKAFYPGDRSMDRVPALENSVFNFGDR
jgi:hypothetical protein